MIADWLAEHGTEPTAPAVALRVMVDATVLLALAWGAHAVLGRRRALVRSGLWNAVLLALVLQPALTLTLPRVHVACLPARESTRDVGGSHEEVTNVATGRGRSQAPENPPRTTSGPSPGRSAEPPPVAALTRAIEIGLSPAICACVAVYLTVAAGLFLRLMASLSAAAWLKKMSVTVDEPEWTRRLEDWRARLGLSRPVRLLCSEGTNIPLVLGWFRPAVIVPVEESDPEVMSGARIDSILLHELAHLRRGDDWWNLLRQFVAVLYWPHPLIWPISRTIADLREQACDDFCVRWLGARGYRSALIAAAARLLERPAVSPAAALRDGTRVGLGLAPAPAVDGAVDGGLVLCAAPGRLGNARPRRTRRGGRSRDGRAGTHASFWMGAHDDRRGGTSAAPGGGGPCLRLARTGVRRIPHDHLDGARRPDGRPAGGRRGTHPQ